MFFNRNKRTQLTDWEMSALNACAAGMATHQLDLAQVLEGIREIRRTDTSLNLKVGSNITQQLWVEDWPAYSLVAVRWGDSLGMRAELTYSEYGWIALEFFGQPVTEGGTNFETLPLISPERDWVSAQPPTQEVAASWATKYSSVPQSIYEELAYRLGVDANSNLIAEMSTIPVCRGEVYSVYCARPFLFSAEWSEAHEFVIADADNLLSYLYLDSRNPSGGVFMRNQETGDCRFLGDSVIQAVKQFLAG